MTWRPPARGNKRDKRCVFSTKHDIPGVTHSRLIAAHWCYGCGYYVCDRCNESKVWTGPEHKVESHQPSEQQWEN